VSDTRESTVNKGITTRSLSSGETGKLPGNYNSLLVSAEIEVERGEGDYLPELRAEVTSIYGLL
jgi:hypothetical protein